MSNPTGMTALPRLLRAALATVAIGALVLPVSASVAGDPKGRTSFNAGRQNGPDDAVVIAVIDSGISPYHWDFLASKMPQAMNRDRSDDLPLTKPPHTWLPGFPSPKAFKSYNGLSLSLPNGDPDASPAELRQKDDAKWSSVRTSGPSGLNYYWFPGTKVIGAISFDYEEQAQKQIDEKYYDYTVKPIHGEGTSEHGMGTSSVSVGNMFGTCPECLLVFIQSTDTTSTERALAWAQSQPWIDVVSNSYGLQTFPTGDVRDGLYGGPTETQKKASERGQTIVFSAGNGIENGFTVPFSTLTSSVKGPDWVITVGATHPTAKGQFTGSGKPVDVAGIGSGYPSAYNGTSVTTGRNFSGTSNAAPTISGTYGRGLYLTRRAMAGRSRVQSNGLISVGAAKCGKARPKCEVGDGRVTAVELRNRLLKGAVPTGKGTTVSPLGLGGTTVPPQKDETFMSEGHGTYLARLGDDEAAWLAEFNRFYLPVVGQAAELKRPAGEAEWFVVDSWCRQHVFGSWNGGYYAEGKTALPAPDPANAPVRLAYQVACNALTKVPATPRP